MVKHHGGPLVKKDHKGRESGHTHQTQQQDLTVT